jgi:hypothetical protein
MPTKKLSGRAARSTFWRALLAVWAAAVLAACLPQEPLPQPPETSFVPAPSPSTTAAPAPLTPVPPPPPSTVPVRLQNVFLKADVPLGWSSLEGPYPTEDTGLGWAAFSSWGEQTFSSERMPDNGVFAALFENTGSPAWERYGPEQGSAALASAFASLPCQQEGIADRSQTLIFQWSRQFRVEVRCGALASPGDRLALKQLLESWRFEASAPGDLGWALAAASQKLPLQVSPEQFIFPAVENLKAERVDGRERRTTSAVRAEDGSIYIHFTYAWDELPLAQELGPCPYGPCRSWGFIVRPSSEIETAGEYGVSLPDPSRPTAAPVPTLPPLRSSPVPPPFIYVHERQVYEVRPGSEKLLGRLSGELGEVHASVIAAEAIYLLREHGLERLDLESGQARTLQVFELPALFGQVQASSDGEEIYYAASLDTGCGVMGFGSQVGLYNDRDQQTRLLVADEGSSLLLLGPSADRSSVLLQPVGCDPSFMEIWQVDAVSGEIERKLPVQGDGFSKLSPRSRYFATLLYQQSPQGNFESRGVETWEHVLAIYDLAARTINPLIVRLPVPDTEIREMIWAPDAASLYFTLASAEQDPSGEVVAYGVWRVNPFSGAVEKVTGGMPGGALRITQNRHWMLARLPGQSIAMQIALEDGATRPLTLPWAAVPGQGSSELPTFLSPEGSFFLVWHTPQGKASLVHLGSGTVGALEIPSGAHLVGWK